MITLKTVIHEDFVNYKKGAMLLAFPNCTWKCEGCHNRRLESWKNVNVELFDLVCAYIKNPLTEAIIFAGLEPFDCFPQMLQCVEMFRRKTSDPIIIYTGYTEEEVEAMLEPLQNYPNIIVKFGRYLPENQTDEVDEILGVKLASSNQYAKIIS